MEIQKIAAFSQNNKGGNPAGVVLCNEFPTDKDMLKTAKQVGYSETAFLKQISDGWRVRYFAPEMEVPFCGHATIASGAVLGKRFGKGDYKFILNSGEIKVKVEKFGTDSFTVTLRSPETWSKPVPQEYVNKILTEFNLTTDNLDADFPVRFAFAGAKHLILFLKDRKKLAEMAYHFERLKNLMQKEGVVTINLLWRASKKLFYSRNPFPTGGVIEDPATGAAAAALGGYLRDINWQGGNNFDVLQGTDMGCPSHLSVEFSETVGEGVKVTGETRQISEVNG
ncbi:MAG: PhzF family phenazine biosynthesis protein [Xanthomonadales bacterium]|nr:PhzF family phenazine biosynthesis protein [Xanthomonadales bacterium]